MLINISRELYGVCRNRPRCADEGHSSPEKNDVKDTETLPKGYRRLPLRTICANVTVCANNLAKNSVTLTEDM